MPSYLYQDGQPDGKVLTFMDEHNYHDQQHQYHPSDNLQMQWNYASSRMLPMVDQYYPNDYITNYEYLYNTQNPQMDQFPQAQLHSYSYTQQPQQQMNPSASLRNTIEQNQPRQQQMQFSISKKRSLKEAWLERYNQLRQFKEEHGHADVPQTYTGNKTLGKWVGKQREMYKIYLQNRSPESESVERQPCSLNDERVEMLNQLGFRWAIGKGQAAKIHGIFDSSENKKMLWEQKYKQLKKFQEDHGHVDVSSKVGKSLDEVELMRWIKAQRLKYKDVQENKIIAGQVLIERFNKLKDLGVDLNFPPVSMGQDDNYVTTEDRTRPDKDSIKPALSRSQLWENRYQALVDFVEKNGHSNVSYTQDYSLARWTLSQREYYSDLQNNIRTSYNPLTEERIERMTKLGFEFSMRDVKFEDRLKELKAFSEAKGHLNVRHWQNKPLYDWILRQRKYFKDFIEGKQKNSITLERITQLENIGFDWQYIFREVVAVPTIDIRMEEARSPYDGCVEETQLFEAATEANESHTADSDLIDNAFKYNATDHQLEFLPKNGTNLEKWMINYRALQDFYRQHSHCRVPGRYKENPKLGVWVKLQREDYKHYREGKKSPMDEWRIHMLQQIGFEFSVYSTEEKKNSWNRRVKELIEYKRVHGDCDVPQSYPSLGKWVAKIRLKYRRFIAGEDTNLTTENIDQLTEIGFRFSVGKGKNPWESFYLDLLEFKRKFGHTHIPLNYTDDRALGFWAYQQRLENAKLAAGKKVSSKFRTRLEKLHEAGFVFYSAADNRRTIKRKITDLSAGESDGHSNVCVNGILVGVEGEEVPCMLVQTSAAV